MGDYMIKINENTDLLNFIDKHKIICIFYVHYDIVNEHIHLRTSSYYNYIDVYHEWLSIDKYMEGIEIKSNIHLILVSNRFITDKQISDIERIIRTHCSTLFGINYKDLFDEINAYKNKSEEGSNQQFITELALNRG